MFSRWLEAWCLVSETIQMYGSQASTAARSGYASVPIVDLAPPRGPMAFSLVPRLYQGQLGIAAKREALEPSINAG